MLSICRRLESFMRPTKVLGEDRASTSEPEGHSEKAAPLPEIFDCRISLSTYCIWMSKDSSRLEGASEQGFAPILVSVRRTY